MTLEKTQEAAIAAISKPLHSLAREPEVIEVAAFEISPAAYDELTQVFKARGYDHVFDEQANALVLNYVAFTRGPEAK